MNRLHEELQSFDATLPLEQARTIPNTWYLSSDVYELETQAVFANSWQMVGRLDQLQEVGSFVTANLAGEPILVVRDPDKQLRAFVNVCRHRAAPIVNEPCGKVSKLRCRYHGWTYDLTGKLRGTPEFDGVQNFCKEEQGLPELAISVWEALVFVHLDPPKQTLETFLAPLPTWMLGRGIEQLKFVHRQEYDLNCNWKVYVDNYLDGGYHVNTVHPALSGVLDYSQYRTTVHGNTSLQSSPLTSSGVDDQTSRTRKGDLAAYWWVWPNFMLNLYDGVMDTNLVLPMGPDRCKVIFDFYFRDTQDRSFIEESIRVANEVQDEDRGICEEVQQGLRSRTYRTGRFSVKREIAGYYFHQLLGQALQKQNQKS